jgi:protein-disulfide isomerase
MLGWTNDIPRLGRYAYWYSGMIAAASVVMASISFFAMSVFCVFCIAAYLISFAVLYLLHGAQDEDQRPPKDYIRELFTSARIYLVFILMIPLLSLFLNHSMASQQGPKTLQRLAKRVIEQWRVAPAITFTLAPALIKGAPDSAAKLILTEFADFRCIHCKGAVSTINAFLSSRPDVQVRFHFFPLDKACNDSVSFENGISCVLAKAVVCAEETSQKGWTMHDTLFAHQNDFNSSGMSVDAAKSKVSAFAADLNVNGEPFKTCLESPELQERIKKMAKEGADAGISGTPAFFVNGKKLEAGQVLPVLEGVYSDVTSQTTQK